MAKFVSVRLSNKFESKAEATHDFHDSHGRKLNNNPNLLINIKDGSVAEFHRDVSEKINITELMGTHKKNIDLAKIDYKKHHPRAMKSNTNLEFSGIITFGNEDQTLSRAEVDKLDQRQLDANALAFVQKFAKENGIQTEAAYLVKHVDESMIHYHFKVIAYDFEKHEVMRNRMSPYFMSELQDLAGECFKPSGFARGIKKIDRIGDILESKGLTLNDYKAMSSGDKLVIMKEANVKNKSPRKLHIDLKNAAYDLQQSFDKSLVLFDLVERSTPEEIKAIKEDVDSSDDKIIKRFFTYALRLHNGAADKKKAIKNLEATIAKLDKRKEDLEATFRRFSENSVSARIPTLVPTDTSPLQKKGTSFPGGYVLIKEKDLDKIEDEANSLRTAYLKLHAEHVAQAQAIAPFAADINILHKRLEQTQSDEQHEARLKAINRALENGLARFGNDSDMKEIVIQNYQRDTKKLHAIIDDEIRLMH